MIDNENEKETFSDLLSVCVFVMKVHLLNGQKTGELKINKSKARKKSNKIMQKQFYLNIEVNKLLLKVSMAAKTG